MLEKSYYWIIALVVNILNPNMAILDFGGSNMGSEMSEICLSHLSSVDFSKWDPITNI